MIRPYLFPLPLLAMAEACAQAPQAPATADLGGSMWQMFFGLAPCSRFLAGALAERCGATVGIASGGVLVFIAAIFVFVRFPSLRRLE